MLEKLKQKMESMAAVSYEASIALIPNKVAEDIQKERYNICSSCEFLYKPTDTCKKCGCFMKYKTWMSGQKCPINKWLAVETEKNNDSDT